ncbi:MAG: glutathione S-transferase C-terminal domain-containing protein [Cyanobacteria bacterium P01_H01_bin.152]
MQNLPTDTSTIISTARETVVPRERRTFITDPHPLPTQPAKPTDTPRFELYNAGLSICSNKVRMTLAHQKLPYISHEVKITYPEQENYNPAYVRLRLASDIAQKMSLSSGYSGGSSVQASGFDALVVPTLVDVEQQAIIADSKLICLYLCEKVNDDALLPADIREPVLAQLDIVDRFPHVALLYGANPDNDQRPPLLRQAMATVHDLKVTALKATWDGVRGEDARLDAAYAAKIAKEKAGETFVGTPDHMRSVIAETERLIAEFGETLANSGGPWSFGDRFTLADIFWIVSLFRLEFLGYGWLWRDHAERAHISHYTEAGYALKSMQTAVCHWPGYPPSYWVAKWLPSPSS